MSEASVLMSSPHVEVFATPGTEVKPLAGVKRPRAADDDDKEDDAAPDCAVCQACTTHFRPF